MHNFVGGARGASFGFEAVENSKTKIYGEVELVK